MEVIVVDNISTDGTPELIAEKFPHVKIIRSKKNLGYGNGVNLGVKNTDKDYLIILNPDTWFKSEFLEELIKPLENDKKLVTTPKTLFYDKSKINTCGNINQFTGIAFTRGLGNQITEFNKSEIINGLSGVCFAIEKENFLKIGGFDKNIFLYMEDTELSWRINSKNIKILYIPKAILYHDYTLDVTAEKIYNLERGRYLILKKYFTWKEFLMFLPSLMLTELFTWSYAFLKGFDGIKFKFKALKDGFKLEVEKIDCDKKQLFGSLDVKFPNNEGQNLLNNHVKKISNLFYFVNYVCIMGIWNIHLPNLNHIDTLTKIDPTELEENIDQIKRIK